MRFIENGPDIPGELLEARDQGSVVFFCGSGVSRAHAKLPDFIGLAQDVLADLRVPADSDAAVVFREIRDLGNRLPVSGLISVDLVFGFLERRYAAADIQTAVARCIGREIHKNLFAHKLLMRLAKTPAQRTQLITTNFDRLFSECDPSITNYVSPRLPQLTEFEPLDGIVYLHGRLNEGYSAAENDTLILSPADFGHAYLSAGWATAFFRELARRFTIVFVGYSGDDPPIRYLLEGINRSKSQLGTLFALQQNGSADSLAKWTSKGVTPIAFDSFDALWATLEQWADRADNPGKWRERVISLASQSPRKLKAHERGQVVQLVSSFEGAKHFLDAKPCSEWLCVFDPTIRFNHSAPATTDLLNEALDSPFASYCIDSDPIPSFSKTRRRIASDDIPKSLINVLEPNSNDLASISEAVHSTTMLLTSGKLIPLSKRLQCLSEWIARSINEPTTLWWAMRQPNLHPEIKDRLKWRITRSTAKLDSKAARLWSQLIDALDSNDKREEVGPYELIDHIHQNGWSYTALRLFGQILKHTVKVEQPFFSRSIGLPPKVFDVASFEDICQAKLQIPQLPPHLDVPDEWVFSVCQQLAQAIFQIELACNEYDCQHELDLCPIHIDPNPEIDGHNRTSGLSGLINAYVGLFTRLMQMSPKRARASYLAWPSESATFDRLRIWCLSNSAIVPACEVYIVLNSIDKKLIWNSYTRRDLLVSLKHRWLDIVAVDRASLEQLLLDGPPKWIDEDGPNFHSRRKHNIATLLTWLELKGCDLSPKTSEELNRIRNELPGWNQSYAARAADSREPRGGFVKTDTDFNELQFLPVSDVIEAARQLAGRSNDTFLIEKDPFAGYCAEYPAKALEALSIESGKGQCAVAEWNKFLDPKLRKDDSLEFQSIIANTLLNADNECLAKVSYYVSWWFKDHFNKLAGHSRDLTERLLDKLLDAIKAYPLFCNSAVSADPVNRDWMLEAINSSNGRIAEAIVGSYFSDDFLDKTQHLNRIEQLLSQPGIIRQYTLTILGKDLIRFYRRNPDWTEANILPVFREIETLDSNAAWSGFLWNPGVDDKLFPRLKPGLLEIAKRQAGVRRGHLQSVAALVLLGWLPYSLSDCAQQVTHEELHDVLLGGGPEFRAQILYTLQHELSKSPERRDLLLPSVSILLSEVWPKELEARSPATSASFLHLVLVDATVFEKLIDIVLPFLTMLVQEQGHHFHFQEEEVKPVIDGNPERFLSLLVKVLPEEPELWPYGCGSTLQMIVTADPGLKNDRRYESLQQRWSKRW
jgi:hypothetical protein